MGKLEPGDGAVPSLRSGIEWEGRLINGACWFGSGLVAGCLELSSLGMSLPDLWKLLPPNSLSTLWGAAYGKVQKAKIHQGARCGRLRRLAPDREVHKVCTNPPFPEFARHHGESSKMHMNISQANFWRKYSKHQSAGPAKILLQEIL